TGGFAAACGAAKPLSRYATCVARRFCAEEMWLSGEGGFRRRGCLARAARLRQQPGSIAGLSFSHRDFGGIEKKREWGSDHPSLRLFEQNADVDVGHPSEEFRSWKGKARPSTPPGGVSFTTAPGWLPSSRAITTACNGPASSWTQDLHGTKLRVPAVEAAR
ncbi:MAG: hypothetical protein AB1898_33560, partial [Acidobacteriota bacterium]